MADGLDGPPWVPKYRDWRSIPDERSDNLYERAGLADHCRSTFGDIRSFDTTLAAYQTVQPEIVFHLAAQPLVQRSYFDTIATNVLGTAHVLEPARRTTTARAFVCVTTDKVYRNNGWAWP